MKLNQREAILTINPELKLNESQEQIVNKTIKPFLEWCYQEAFNLSTKSRWQKFKENFAIGIGVTIGAVSVASIYPLGGSFGDVVSDYLGITDPTLRQSIYHFFGTTATIPMLALSCIEAKHLFQKIASSSAEKGIVKYNRKYLRNGLIVFAYVLAAFSALSPMYATIEAFANAPFWLKATTIPASYIGPLIFKSASEIRLIDRALNAFTPEEKQEIRIRRRTLQADLRSTIKFIKQLSDENLDALFFAIFNKNRALKQADERQVQALKRINYFFSQNQRSVDIADDMPLKSASNGKCSNFGRNLFKGLGFGIGAASSYIYYTLAESATLYLCDYLNIHDPETRNTLKTITASMAIVPWGSLGAESTQAVFEKIYNLMSACQNKTSSTVKTPISKKVIAATAVFEGSCASTPPTYLAMQALKLSPWYGKLLIIPAFIGPASIRTMAIARLMEEGVEWLHSFKAETTEIRKEKLVKAIEKITMAFERLPDEQIIQLYDDLIENKPQLFNKIEINPLNQIQEDSSEETPLLIGERMKLIVSSNSRYSQV